MLEKTIGYNFKNKATLETALTHSSYTNESRGGRTVNYERLEFLGDSILGFATADYLYFSQPEVPEGELTRMRANLVCEQNLVSVAEQIELGRYLLLGKGEEATNGRSRASILADVIEAIIGGIYIDGGVDESKRFIKRFILSNESLRKATKNADYKTELQELVQKDRDSVLLYRLVSENGPDHNKEFVCEAVVNETVMGQGTGRSKKEAEQAAARDSLIRYGRTDV
ncbi:MAG: ribonuclease III [Oscillospiraceae bacterium]|jgi:ribonuclease-3|nr:ribonuclease III [Oscillospiraceae bacterium]